MKLIGKLIAVAFFYCLLVSSFFPAILSTILTKTFPLLIINISSSISYLTIALILIEFGIFYIIGKKYDLTKSFGSYVLSIYIGAAIGLITAIALTPFIVPIFGGSEVIDEAYLAYSFSISLANAVPHLFTGIAGLSVSYLHNGTRAFNNTLVTH